MKDRIVTFSLAIAAFALFYTLMLHRPSSSQESETRPVTTERGENGYLALLRWLEAIDVRPVSFRERFYALPQVEDMPATGNLLITTAPHRYPMRDSEAAPLRNWISSGNTLLVVAGLSDTPEWSMGEGIDQGFMKRMELMTGLTFTQVLKEADDKAETTDSKEADEPESEATVNPLLKLEKPLEFEMAPNGTHPLLEGVKTVRALSEYETAKWRAHSSETTDLVLELASDPQTGEPVLWLVRYGQGQILVSAYGSVFVNKLLGEKDNARLLANIIHWSLRGKGRVLIDDAHQGLVAFYDPAKFYSDKRLHASLWWLVGLWLVFVLGSQRLRVQANRWQPVNVTTFVRASGGFMARVLKPAIAAQQLFTNFFNDLRRQTGQPVNGAPLWDWMESRSIVAAPDLAQMRELHDRTQRGRRIDLPRLQNLLNRVRQQLT